MTDKIELGLLVLNVAPPLALLDQTQVERTAMLQVARPQDLHSLVCAVVADAVQAAGAF